MWLEELEEKFSRQAYTVRYNQQKHSHLDAFACKQWTADKSIYKTVSHGVTPRIGLYGEDQRNLSFDYHRNTHDKARGDLPRASYH